MNLELGNMFFNEGNMNQQYECPEYVVALLRDIENRLDTIMYNINQEEYDNPFRNTANKFRIKGKMRVRAYNWNDDIEQKYNFKYGNIKISWYKYLGRDTTINGEYNYDIMINMYNDCIDALNKFERQELEKKENFWW